MKFTDIFVNRPVLASVVSLAILVLGLRAVFSLPVQQYPKSDSSVVTVTTVYYGADPEVVAGFITTPLENAIAQANGIDYMTSSSVSGVSTITVNLRLNYDANRALTEINTKVSSVLNSLPPQSQQPVLQIAVAQGTDAMYIGFMSDILPQNKITDYLVRVVQPRLQAVPGVQTAEILGPKTFALRAWLDPNKLATYGLTAADVRTALATNDYISGLGNTKGEMIQVTLTASTDVHTVDDFKRLVLKQKGDTTVRLGDVANVVLGAEDYDSTFAFDGIEGVAIGIKVAPGANLLSVTKAIRDIFPDVQSQLPAGLNGIIAYDTTEFVTASIKEVIRTLVEALIIVTVVVFAFMGSPRAVFIPVIAMPLSLVGSFAIMLAFGFSINLFMLLAIVLAIGLVVDDAIIVVENVTRHMEEGMAPFPAALLAARELGGPIIAMTIVLIAVYVPIGFQGGLTGALFVEFAFTLVGAVTISAVVALTLSPMLCARMLRPPQSHLSGDWEERLIAFIDRRFGEVHRLYMRILRGSLTTVRVTVTFAVIILVSIYFLYTGAKSELAPQEDQGFIVAAPTFAPNSTLQQLLLYADQMRDIRKKYPEVDHVFQSMTPGFGIMGYVLKPWNKRARTSIEMQPLMQQDLTQIAGAQVGLFLPPATPGIGGLPVQVSIGTTQSFAQLNDVSAAFLEAAQKTGMFIFLQTDLRIDEPEATVVIDRNRAAQIGLSMNDVGSALSSMLGGGYVNYFSLAGRSYKVIPQVEQRSRLNVDQILDYQIRAPDGSMLPLSTVASIKTKAIPESLNRFQQLNSATIQGVPMPGVTLGDALASLQDLAKRTLPAGYTLDYGGTTRQYVQESSGFLMTFGFAVIVIFLALAALFESFRDPLIILISVPMSIAGALIFISLGVGGTSLNIYTDVGLVTLMGVISKHGILLVEFANDAQENGKSKREAIEESASKRLRPILMTTAAMVFGVMPLVLATGAGAGARFSIGLVVATGIAIGTLFTLFVVPAVYLVFAADHHVARQAMARESEEPA